jgi:YD repeat-containing protein
MRLRAPPRIRVLEALGAIADERVKIVSTQEASVTDPDGKTQYAVKWDASANKVSSTDPGTRLKGYFGYPVIAVLMVQGVLPYDPSLASKLVGIKWRALNEKYKDHDRVVEEVLRGWYWNDRKKLFRFTKWILDMLSELDIERGEKETLLTNFVQL